MSLLHYLQDRVLERKYCSPCHLQAAPFLTVGVGKCQASSITYGTAYTIPFICTSVVQQMLQLLSYPSSIPFLNICYVVEIQSKLLGHDTACATPLPVWSIVQEIPQLLSYSTSTISLCGWCCTNTKRTNNIWHCSCNTISLPWYCTGNIATFVIHQQSHSLLWMML